MYIYIYKEHHLLGGFNLWFLVRIAPSESPGAVLTAHQELLKLPLLGATMRGQPCNSATSRAGSTTDEKLKV